METVCPALGDQRHLGSRTGTLIGVVVGRCYPELLDRIKSGRQHRSKGIPVGLVVHVDTVERDVALIAARTIHGAIARVLVPVDIRTVAGVGDPGLQAQQIRNIAALQRDLLNLGFIERITNRGIDQIQDGSFAGNCDALASRSYLKTDVGCGRGVDQKLQIGLLVM